MATANATNGTKQPPNGTAQPPDGTKSSPDPKVAEEHFLGVLRKFIKEEKEDLDRFYPTDNAKLRAAATKAAPMYTELIRRKCPSEMAVRFASLTLYDLVVLLGWSHIRFCHSLLILGQTTVIRWCFRKTANDEKTLRRF